MKTDNKIGIILMAFALFIIIVLFVYFPILPPPEKVDYIKSPLDYIWIEEPVQVGKQFSILLHQLDTYTTYQLFLNNQLYRIIESGEHTSHWLSYTTNTQGNLTFSLFSEQINLDNITIMIE